MHIGSVLLQPQRIRRATATSREQALLEDFVTLFIRVSWDTSQGGIILELMGEAMEATARRVAQNMGDGLEKALQDFRSALDPFLSGLTKLVDLLPDSADPVEMIDLAIELFAKVADILKDLSIDQLRPVVAGFLDILKKDLKLSSATLQQQVDLLFDDLINRLKNAPPETDKALRENRLATAGVLRRLKRHLQGQFTLPEIKTDELALAILGLLRRPPIEAATRKANCIGTEMSELLKVGATLTKIVPYTGFGARSLGAGEAAPDADETYLWYPSWLLGPKDQPLGFTILQQLLFRPIMLPPPDDTLWQNNQTKKVTRKNIFRADMEWPEPDVNWEKIPVSQGDDSSKRYLYTFGSISPESMEKWTYHTGWIVDYAETLLNIIAGFQKGHWLSELLFGLLNTSHGTYKLIKKKPLPNALVLPGRAASYVGGSFQQLHWNASGGNWFNYWMVNLGGGALRANVNNLTVNGARDLLLEIFTLYNYKGPKDTPTDDDDRPENRTHIGSVAGLVTTLSVNFILLKQFPRTLYGVQAFDEATGDLMKWWIGGGLATSILAGTVGTVIAESIAWAEDFKVWGKQLLKSSITTLLMFVISLYLEKENDTDDGKYNPQEGGRDWAGYPEDYENSPYRLPYEKDKSVLCVQGNQGFWSHNNFAGPQQIYAYDFGLDEGEEIRASRDGTVVDYFDWVPDDTDPDATEQAAAAQEATDSGFLVANQTTSSTWNFILIRHDLRRDSGGNLELDVGVDDDGNPILSRSFAAYDRIVDGQPITTYGVYGHGRKNSVRESFSVPANTIIGQQVRQGQVIMKAGDTGNSFHNHLHMDVRPGPDLALPAVLPAGAVMQSTLSGTIPFVFREVKNLSPFTKNGVPQSSTYYTSDNDAPS